VRKTAGKGKELEEARVDPSEGAQDLIPNLLNGQTCSAGARNGGYYLQGWAISEDFDLYEPFQSCK
jgi:hypothetical protein